MRKVLAAAVLALVSSIAMIDAAEAAKPAVADEKKVEFYGLAQYRLRLKINNATTLTDKDLRSVDYTNQIGYYVGVKAAVGDVQLQLQIGNDWVSTESVDWKSNNFFGDKSSMYPYFHLAFVKYDLKCVRFTFGIQPLLNYGPLDLIERSMRADKAGRYAYREAAMVGWATGTNNAMTGMAIGAPIISQEKGVKLGVDLFGTVSAVRTQTMAEDPLSNPDAFFLVLNLPVEAGALSVTPQVAATINKLYTAKTEKGDHEIAAGLTAGYKVNKEVSFGISGGGAQFSNASSRAKALVKVTPVSTVDSTTHKVTTVSDTTWDTTMYKNQGILVGANVSVKLGPGPLQLDVKYGSNEDKERADSKTGNIFVDLKYGWACTKNFTVMPRVRYFLRMYGKSDAENLSNESKSEIRPEIILTGKF